MSFWMISSYVVAFFGRVAWKQLWMFSCDMSCDVLFCEPFLRNMFMLPIFKRWVVDMYLRFAFWFKLWQVERFQVANQKWFRFRVLGPLRGLLNRPWWRGWYTESGQIPIGTHTLEALGPFHPFDNNYRWQAIRKGWKLEVWKCLLQWLVSTMP